MINIGNILKRSWHILWNYRTLWFFGFLLALTGGGSGSGSGSGGSSGFRFNSNNNNGSSNSFQPGPFWQSVTDWVNQNISPLFVHPDQHVVTFIWIGVAFLLFILLMGAIASIIRYVSETAAIRMVDEHEQNGTKVGFKQGWKLGWNRRAFRMWVIDLVISLPVILFMLLLVGLGALVFFSATNAGSTLAIGGMIAAGGCALLFVLVFVVLMVFLGLLRPFFVRAAALEETRIGDSFRRGWSMFKGNWKSAALMWLAMIGIGIGYGIVILIIFFMLIPAYILLALPAVIVAAIPATFVFAITSIFSSGVVAWVAAALVALPFFLLVVFAPLTLVSGWYQIFSANVWTLTYREIKALETVKPEIVPAETA